MQSKRKDAGDATTFTRAGESRTSRESNRNAWKVYAEVCELSVRPSTSTAERNKLCPRSGHVKVSSNPMFMLSDSLESSQMKYWPGTLQKERHKCRFPVIGKGDREQW